MKTRITFCLILFILSSKSLVSEIEKPDIILIDTVGYQHRFCYTYELEFVDSLKGYKLLNEIQENRGFVLQKTLDGGYTWQTIFLDTSRYEIVDGKINSFPPLRCFYMKLLPNGTLKLFCGKVLYYQDINIYDYATILTSTDEGETWSTEKFDSLSTIHIHYWGNSPVVKIEFSKSDGRKPFLQNKYYTSLDSGQTWDPIQFPDTMMERTYGDFQLVDSNSIFIKFGVDTAQYASQWEMYPYIYNIKEKKWSKYPIPRYYLSVVYPLFFRTIYYACAIVKVRYQGDNQYKHWDTYLVRTVNGGQTWDTLVDMSVFKDYDSGLARVTYYDSLNIIAYGYDYDLIKTTDGGKTWRELHHKLGTCKEMMELSFDTTQYSIGKFINYSSFMFASWPLKDHLWIMSSERYFAPSYLFKYVEYPSYVAENPNNKKMLSFPNPARTITRISLLQEGNITISAVDMLGRSFPLWSGFASAGEMELDVSALPTGSYTLLIDYGTKREAMRMIKE
jgi:hypothetical protein